MPRLCAACTDAGIEMLSHPIWHQEFCVLRPAIGALGEPDFFLAKRLAMGRSGVDLVGRAIADVAVEND